MNKNKTTKIECGKVTLASAPMNSEETFNRVLIQWKRAVARARQCGRLFPANPIDVYQQGVVLIGRLLKRGSNVDTGLILKRILFRDKRGEFKCVHTLRAEYTALQEAEYNADTWDICEEDYAKYADFYEAQRASRWEVRRQSAIRELAEIWGYLTGYERKLFRAFLSAEGDKAEAARRLKMAERTFGRHFERACLRARAIFNFERKTI